MRQRQPRLSQEEKAVLDALVAQAEEFGKSAFAAGKMAVPAHDGRVRELIGEHGSHAIAILDAWSRAWHRENLR